MFALIITEKKQTLCLVCEKTFSTSVEYQNLVSVVDLKSDWILNFKT